QPPLASPALHSFPTRRSSDLAEAGAALAPDGIDLIHEHDAGRVLLGLIEEVPNAAGANANEHLDKLRPRDREEGHSRFAGHGLRSEEHTSELQSRGHLVCRLL